MEIELKLHNEGDIEMCGAFVRWKVN